MLGDVFRGAGKLIGTVTGPIIGVSVDIIANTLNITTQMAQEAINAGCESYEEIRSYWDLDGKKG